MAKRTTVKSTDVYWSIFTPDHSAPPFLKLISQLKDANGVDLKPRVHLMQFHGRHDITEGAQYIPANVANGVWQHLRDAIKKSATAIIVEPLCSTMNGVTEGGRDWHIPENSDSPFIPKTGDGNDNQAPLALWFLTCNDTIPNNLQWNGQDLRVTLSLPHDKTAGWTQTECGAIQSTNDKYKLMTSYHDKLSLESLLLQATACQKLLALKAPETLVALAPQLCNCIGTSTIPLEDANV